MKANCALCRFQRADVKQHAELCLCASACLIGKSVKLGCNALSHPA